MDHLVYVGSDGPIRAGGHVLHYWVEGGVGGGTLVCQRGHGWRGALPETFRV